MIAWNHLESIPNLDEAIIKSYSGFIMFFKHSTTCPISQMAKLRLEAKWDSTIANEVVPYYLDLLTYRSISNEIAERFQVHHESPQILLIKDGECIYDASHLDITIDEIMESINYHA